ncbi:SLC13 family permease [Virgibacillus salexigens]|uniref:Transporter n=1 Tax=Virgibacillus kapii TaxID=1638645 RepID=A0ABQ2DFB5_9BACI|nr:MULTISPECIES: SLC13 family permease [Virgibacillus]GGJ54445.1 transporter [Virgibacillus kapii]
MLRGMAESIKISKSGLLESRLPFKNTVVLILHLFYLMAVVLPGALDYSAKVSLFIFLSAMTCWVLTKLPAGFIAIAALMAIILLGGATPSILYDALAQEVVWLMIGAFIMGEAVKQSGLTDRMIDYLLKNASCKEKLLRRLTNVLLLSAFFVPSTSGRAALAKPLIAQIGERWQSEKEKRFLALFTPILILISTSATVIGAGSHLIGVGLLENATGQSITYIQWFIWGVPFTIVISFLTLYILKWMIWPKEKRNEKNHVTISQQQKMDGSLNQKEIRALGFIGLVLLGWLTHPIHHYDIGFITMLGAMLFMAPVYGVITWKQAVNSVSWPLILFVACATTLGGTLIDTGVINWLEKELFIGLNLINQAPEWLLLLIILLITITSHFYIHSHTTRAVIFIPSLIVFSETIGLDSTSVVFLSLIGMNYCLTFPVSSKAILLFAEDTSFDKKQLLQLSGVLMPVYILVMVFFYFTYWQWTGLQL